MSEFDNFASQLLNANFPKKKTGETSLKSHLKNYQILIYLLEDFRVSPSPQLGYNLEKRTNTEEGPYSIT